MPFMRTRRQDVAAGNDDLLAGTGQPGIDPWIDADELLGPEAVIAREVVEGVLIDGLDGLVLAEHHIAGIREGIYGCARGRDEREPERRAGRYACRGARRYARHCVATIRVEWRTFT